MKSETHWKHEIAFASSLNSGRLIPSRSSSGLILLFFHFLTNRVTRLSKITADNQLDHSSERAVLAYLSYTEQTDRPPDVYCQYDH
jgi:hypothetical protein